MSEAWKERFVEVNGVRLYVEEGGAGPPIVFLHGYSLDLTYWRPVAEMLRATHRVILYDSRGAGKSSGAVPAYSFAEHAEDLAALLRALGVTRPLLCGHSMGGDIVLQYAVTYPQQPAALIVADAPGPYNLWVGMIGGTALALVYLLGGMLGLAQPQRLALPLFRYLFWSRPFRSSHPEVIEAWKQQLLSCSIADLRSESLALAWREKLTGRLAAIGVPTLLLQGSLDALVAERQMCRYQQHIQGSRLQRIEGSGHMTPNEKPQEFGELVAAFLASLQEPAR
jgi:3-oxoadipate enol-lactonase